MCVAEIIAPERGQCKINISQITLQCIYGGCISVCTSSYSDPLKGCADHMLVGEISITDPSPTRGRRQHNNNSTSLYRIAQTNWQ